MPLELQAHLRSETGTHKVNRLRRQGLVPAVLYGGESRASTALSVSASDVLHLLHSGQRVLALKFAERTAQVLLKAVQYDALGEAIIHVDFNELRAGQKVHVRIPVSLRGAPKGVADGGVLRHVLHELEIACLPSAIPERVVVDVENLGLGEALHVAELKLPDGVAALTRGDEVVAACATPREEEAVAAAPAEVAALEPEVLTEKKEEAEGEAAAAAPEKEKKPAEPKKAEPRRKEGR
jgi:large subunit ribosomal protein L25